MAAVRVPASTVAMKALMIALLSQFAFQLCHAVITLEQTVPPRSLPACPGEMVVFTCASNDNAVAWQAAGSLYIFNDPEQINMTINGEIFNFLLVEVNGSMYTSTATIPSASSGDNDLLLSCTDGITILSRNVLISAQPEGCQGIVACSVSRNTQNSMLTDVTVTILSVPRDLTCVVGYVFSFNNESMYVAKGSSPSATFTVNRDLAMEYPNQVIMTVDAENRTGEHSCNYSLTGPDPIPEMEIIHLLECNETYVTLILEWNRPSLGVENCLDPTQLVWEYIVVVKNFTDILELSITETIVTIDRWLSSMSDYNISITPLLFDLGLSGNPSTTNIVPNIDCTEPTAPGVSLPLVVTIPISGVFLLFGIISLFIFCCCWYWRRKRFCSYRSSKNFMKYYSAAQRMLEIRVVKISLTGPPCVGKTSTRKRLVQKIANPGSQSCKSSLDDQKPCILKLFHKAEQHSVLMTNSVRQWNEQDVGAQCQTLLEYIILVSELRTDTNEDRISISSSESSFGEAEPLCNSEEQLNRTEKYLPLATVQAASLLDQKRKKYKSEKDPYMTVARRQQCTNVREDFKSIEDMSLLHITDTGGQPEFHDIINLVLPRPAVFLFFLDLRRSLEEHFQINSCLGKGNTRESQFTVKQVLLRLLTNDASQSEKRMQPSVVIIGTHFDAVKAEGLKKFEKELNEVILSQKPFTEVVKSHTTKDGEKSFIFPIDNQNSSLDEFKKLQDEINSVIQTFQRTRVSASSLLLQLLLRQEYERDPGYCTLQQAKKVAGAYGIPSDEIEAILKFMHMEFGTVLYYSDVPSAKEVVICNPDVIIDFASTLITPSPSSSHTHLMRVRGEIDPNSVDKKDREKKFPLPTKCVLDLFTHFYIISKIKDDYGFPKYFMPSLLVPDRSVGEESIQSLSAMEPAPLLITFSSGYMPQGCFSALVCILLNQNNWRFKPGVPRYKNRIQFALREPGDTMLTLMRHIDCLELQIWSSEHTSIGAFCSQGVVAILKAIKTLKDRHPFFKFDNSLCFYCFCDHLDEKKAPHKAVWVERVPSYDSWKCSEHEVYMRCQYKPKEGGKKFSLQRKHTVWFTEDSDIPTFTGRAQSPELQQRSHFHVQTHVEPPSRDSGFFSGVQLSDTALHVVSATRRVELDGDIPIQKGELVMHQSSTQPSITVL